jgi:hypothetical protein
MAGLSMRSGQSAMTDAKTWKVSLGPQRRALTQVNAASRQTALTSPPAMAAPQAHLQDMTPLSKPRRGGGPRAAR